ncbi:hypothetical protein HDV05_000220 [Chytridiales sp. JEL 0842]|nr:hypothetical protein HDV05_000220 [Chytridiales sp. JEL 0842]
MTKWKKRYLVLYDSHLLIFRSHASNELPISALVINDSSDVMVSQDDQGGHIVEVRTERPVNNKYDVSHRLLDSEGPSEQQHQQPSEVTPRVWKLQADSEDQAMHWLFGLQELIESHFNSPSAQSVPSLTSGTSASASVPVHLARYPDSNNGGRYSDSLATPVTPMTPSHPNNTPSHPNVARINGSLGGMAGSASPNGERSHSSNGYHHNRPYRDSNASSFVSDRDRMEAIDRKVTSTSMTSSHRSSNMSAHSGGGGAPRTSSQPYYNAPTTPPNYPTFPSSPSQQPHYPQQQQQQQPRKSSRNPIPLGLDTQNPQSPHQSPYLPPTNTNQGNYGGITTHTYVPQVLPPSPTLSPHNPPHHAHYQHQYRSQPQPASPTSTLSSSHTSSFPRRPSDHFPPNQPSPLASPPMHHPMHPHHPSSAHLNSNSSDYFFPPSAAPTRKASLAPSQFSSLSDPSTPSSQQNFGGAFGGGSSSISSQGSKKGKKEKGFNMMDDLMMGSGPTGGSGGGGAGGGVEMGGRSKSKSKRLMAKKEEAPPPPALESGGGGNFGGVFGGRRKEADEIYERLKNVGF